MPGTRSPDDVVGAAALTPPPLSHAPVSDAPTLSNGTPIPGATQALPYARQAPSAPSPGNISAFHSLQQGVVFGGRYEILGVLGQGGMGAVYKARDRELDRLIALKVIRPELAMDPAILQRFKQELILSRNITHKNVVRIYDLGEADGIRFISMEYVDGEDLRTILRREGKLSSKEAITVVEQVCRALDSAHAEGVIHRDLKPQNIMRDKYGRIVVMDFGLARSLGDSGLTQTGAIVGTLEYMSPEQALGSTLDQRSDIFSVGLIFYELLTGKAPY
jgi:eukaryotic-like serine/threonine-protein kinase